MTFLRPRLLHFFYLLLTVSRNLGPLLLSPADAIDATLNHYIYPCSFYLTSVRQNRFSYPLVFVLRWIPFGITFLPLVHSIRFILSLKPSVWPRWIREDFREDIFLYRSLQRMNELTYLTLFLWLTLCQVHSQNANGHQKEVELHICHRMSTSILRLKTFSSRVMFLLRSSQVFIRRRLSNSLIRYPPRRALINSNRDCYGIQTVRI